MGRPPQHTADALLDAGVQLFASGGARAVTMTAVARTAGAPSGSVYHRFADRPALLFAMWRRAVRAFDADVRDLLGDDPTPERAVEVAVAVVEWCREHPGEAAVLHAGRGAFSPETWPAEDAEQLADEEAVRDREVRGRVKKIAAAADRRPDEVAFAMIELPISIVRRYLPEPVPARSADLVRRLATRIVGSEGQ